MMESMLKQVADNVTGVIAPCGHYIPEEAPDFVVEHLLGFWNKGLSETSELFGRQVAQPW